MNDYIKSLLDQIEHLKSEVSFLRRELKDKNAFAKTNINPGSDNKNQQNVYGNQDRKLSVTTNESSTLPKKGKTSSNNKNNNRGNTKKTVLKHKMRKIIIKTTKNMTVILKNQKLLLKTKK